MPIVLAAFLAAAAPAAGPDLGILGTWHGTSTCVDRARHPACKDEDVIYEFREIPGKPGVVHQKADKVVDGKVLPMGEMDFLWDPERRAWTSEFRNERVHILWSLAVRGDAIEGTLVDLPDGSLVRSVSAKRR